MSMPRFTDLLLLLSLSFSAFAQQPNGRNYSLRTKPIGNVFQSWHDIQVNGYVLTVPVKTGAGPYASWGQFHVSESAADAAGTNSHGMALYSATGTMLCYVYANRTSAIGVNSYTLSGCGTP
jgi:hypothetical protein